VSYTIEFTAAAHKDLAKLAKGIRSRVDATLMILKTNPRPPGAKKLQGQWRSYYRVRVGDFRIIYAIEDAMLVICVVRIRDRKEAY
jgi:mRNA interferase RelE/StbE